MIEKAGKGDIPNIYALVGLGQRTQGVDQRKEMSMDYHGSSESAYTPKLLIVKKNARICTTYWFWKLTKTKSKENIPY